MNLISNKSRNLLNISVIVLATLTLAGCARNINPNTYKASHVGEASFTYQGVIASARQITVSEGERLEDNTTGIALGAVTGGLAGTQIGSGRGQIASTVGGAILGGVAGAFAEKALKEQTAMEYIVRLTNGSMMTVVQGPEANLAIGQRVFVQVSHDGRSRVIADNSPIQEVQPMMTQPVVRAKIVHSGLR